MKNAVATAEMTIDQANSLIIQRTKQDNQDLVKSTIKNEKTKEFNQFCKSIMKLSADVEQQVPPGAKDGVERSPTLQKRVSPPKKQSSRKNVLPSPQIERNYQIKREMRPQSAQNHTIYT